LDDTALLADVDFLARSNQSNHYTPLGYAVRELDEEFWLGLVVGGAAVLVSDLYHFRIERPLCLVIDQYVLGRNPPVVAGIRFYVVLYVAYENATTAAGISQFVLQDLDKRTVAAQEDCWGCGLPVAAVDR
jgi:hypothetical protein